MNWVYHFGQIVIHEDRIFIDHWYKYKKSDGGEFAGPGTILVLNGDGASIAFERWIVLDDVDGQRAGLIGIDFEAKRIFTAGPDQGAGKLYCHDMDGKLIKEPGSDKPRPPLTLMPGLDSAGYAQGGFFSPNRHIYISSGSSEDSLSDEDGRQQYIYCYSLLNGARMGTIAIPSEPVRQELEGCCHAPLVNKGTPVQIHAVLLENEWPASDDIFLKSFSAAEPERI